MNARSLIESYWHGTASGDLRGGKTGLHVGTRRAAEDALHATIGYPVEGDWDGTREYGKTLLCGAKTLKERGVHATGFNCGGIRKGSQLDISGKCSFYRGHPDYIDLPEDDFYPTDCEYKATFSNSEPVPMTAKPDIFELDIIGKMSNAPWTPHGDWQANGRMKGLLARGKARRGYFYRNCGEDPGSISAVLPSSARIRKLVTPAKTDPAATS